MLKLLANDRGMEDPFDLEIVNEISQRHKIDGAVNTDDLLGEVAVNKRMWRPPASLPGSAKTIWITCASSTQSHTEVKARVQRLPEWGM